VHPQPLAKHEKGGKGKEREGREMERKGDENRKWDRGGEGKEGRKQ